MSVRMRVAALVAALVFPATTYGAEPAPIPKPAKDPADVLAALIDKYLAKDWDARGIIPAEITDDSEFCRRVYLDLVGRAPKASESRAFIDDKAPDKRIKLVFVFDPRHKWQKIFFDALWIFEKEDGLFRIQPIATP